MEINIYPEIVAFFVGVALALGWVLTVLGVDAWQAVWRWIDDDETPAKPNALLHWIMTKKGYTRDRGSDIYPYQRNDGKDISNGATALWLTAFLLIWAPLAVAISVRFYPVALTAITLYMLARLARFARRHKKLFDKHLKDPEAHK